MSAPAFVAQGAWAAQTTPAAQTAPAGPDTLEWALWSTTARIVVCDPAALAAAHRIVVEHLDAVDLAASRFRDDSELAAVNRSGGRSVTVGPLLADLVAVALEAARNTDGDVDPTVGAAMVGIGYDRDLADLARADPTPRPAADAVARAGGFSRISHRPASGWRGVRLDGRSLRVPSGTVLDLGATAKAAAADQCAHLVAQRLGVGVLVSLGGDIATAGQARGGGWQVLVQDTPGDPACTVLLPSGAAIATSSTVRRRWLQAGAEMHHVLDPATGLPVAPVWRSVTAAAHTCVAANTLTTAALVRGRAALPWLRSLGVPARLVTAAGEVVTTPDWPEEAVR